MDEATIISQFAESASRSSSQESHHSLLPLFFSPNQGKVSASMKLVYFLSK
jgi:hypothetical protein